MVALGLTFVDMLFLALFFYLINRNERDYLASRHSGDESASGCRQYIFLLLGMIGNIAMCGIATYFWLLGIYTFLLCISLWFVCALLFGGITGMGATFAYCVNGLWGERNTRPELLKQIAHELNEYVPEEGNQNGTQSAQSQVAQTRSRCPCSLY